MYKYIYYAIAINEREAMNLKGSGKRHMGGFGGRKMKGEIL